MLFITYNRIIKKKLLTLLTIINNRKINHAFFQEIL